jgi:hypothetical protein
LNQGKSISGRYFGNFVKVPPAVNHSASNLGLVLPDKFPCRLVPPHAPEAEISTVELIAKQKIQSNLLKKHKKWKAIGQYSVWV